MTGIVIGSVLVLLAVGTGLVAFDGARDIVGGHAPLERVVVGRDAGSAGGKVERKRPHVPPAPVVAAHPPVMVTADSTPATALGHRRVTGERPRRRAAHGDGGTQARRRGSLGGGAPMHDASEDGGGVAATGPPGLTKPRTHTPPGRSRGQGPQANEGHGPSATKGRGPSAVGPRAKGRGPSAVGRRARGRAPSVSPGRAKGRAVGRGRGLGLEQRNARGGKAAGGGAAPVLLP